MDEIQKPDVRSYLDILQFLQDYYKFEKERRIFSYEIWARALSVTSKSYLRFAIVGKRKISEQLAQKMCDYFKFENTDREYFILLILYSQCKQPSQKSIYGSKLTHLLRQSSRAKEVSMPEDVLANPLCIVLRDLLSFQNLSKTPESLGKILGASEAETLRLLELLQTAKLAVHENGQWKASDDFIRVSAKPNNAALLNYHRACLEKAIAAQTLPADQRNYRALNLAFTTDEYQEYLKDLNNFAAQIFTKYESKDLTDRRIYQIHFNLFPWTQVINSNQYSSPVLSDLKSQEIL